MWLVSTDHEFKECCFHFKFALVHSFFRFDFRFPLIGCPRYFSPSTDRPQSTTDVACWWIFFGAIEIAETAKMTQTYRKLKTETDLNGTEPAISLPYNIFTNRPRQFLLHHCFFFATLTRQHDTTTTRQHDTTVTCHWLLIVSVAHSSWQIPFLLLLLLQQRLQLMPALL